MQWAKGPREGYLPMKMLGSFLELGKTILAPIIEYYNYYEGADEHLKNLKRKRDDLDYKKVACKKILEVTELIDQSCGFGDCLVIGPLVRNGDELPTRALVGGSTLEKIWKHLLDEDFRMIGVYGMGGIGKIVVMKEINNRLLKERDKFNYAIWVTVSKAFNVIKLQNDIACHLNLENELSKFKDETTRAGKLYAELKKRKRYVLILDETWKAFPLEIVKIP
ncbi:putative disease resistance protein [Quercus suber]|uniref:Disease resistance protein n=1 Tax=Quercus suber TaxID=58331 RepID=A0AAW0LZ30_QUESU